MYKVFFNDRKIFLDDSLPDMSSVGKDFVCAFENITDLKPQLRQFLDPGKHGNLYIFHDDKDSLLKTFSQCFKYIEAGGGLLKNGKGEILLIYRRGKWDLPKGKTESGESIRETAVREVQEECGLEPIELLEFLTSTHHIYSEGDQFILKKTDWFSMVYKGKSRPVPMQKEDITEARWVKPSELDQFLNNTYDSIEEILSTSV